VSLTCKRGSGETTGDTFGSRDTRRFVRYEPSEIEELAATYGFDVLSLDTTEEWIGALFAVESDPPDRR
jgi:hypothetical protein